jgi:hypothetical protein
MPHIIGVHDFRGYILCYTVFCILRVLWSKCENKNFMLDQDTPAWYMMLANFLFAPLFQWCLYLPKGTPRIVSHFHTNHAFAPHCLTLILLHPGVLLWTLR